MARATGSPEIALSVLGISHPVGQTLGRTQLGRPSADVACVHTCGCSHLAVHRGRHGLRQPPAHVCQGLLSLRGASISAESPISTGASAGFLHGGLRALRAPGSSSC